MLRLLRLAAAGRAGGGRRPARPARLGREEVAAELRDRGRGVLRGPAAQRGRPTARPAGRAGRGRSARTPRGRGRWAAAAPPSSRRTPSRRREAAAGARRGAVEHAPGVRPHAARRRAARAAWPARRGGPLPGPDGAVARPAGAGRPPSPGWAPSPKTVTIDAVAAVEVRPAAARGSADRVVDCSERRRALALTVAVPASRTTCACPRAPIRWRR